MNPYHPLPWFLPNRFLLFLVIVSLTGCGRLLISSATSQLAGNISSAILNQKDPATVKEGAPAYLILLDSLIANDPEDSRLLLTGAKLYGAYAAVFVEDAVRARILADKAWQYSIDALCLEHADTCHSYRLPYADYLKFLDTLGQDDVAVLFSFGASWAGWIQTHSEDWNARADLPKVEATMLRVIALQDDFLQGEPYLYLGVLSILLPPALGGKPEQAKEYFEKAIALSRGRNLMFQVIFAERYGRMLFDRELHDRLLHRVLDSDPAVPGLTLMNTIAQQKAAALLNSADEYF